MQSAEMNFVWYKMNFILTKSKFLRMLKMNFLVVYKVNYRFDLREFDKKVIFRHVW
jgi:hypothetical protein